jgi:glycine/D-amino acid oxidase-like deaminating enzyme
MGRMTPAEEALREARPAIFWLDDAARPDARPPLAQDAEADLVVVGAGLTGLWTALLAKEADPAREVVLLEAGRIADGASGRNGGFVAASLTHGIRNGISRFPGEIARLEQLGRENLDAIAATLHRHGIDAAWEENGELAVATRPHELAGLAAHAAALRAHGRDVVELGRDEVQAEVASPTYLAGVWNRDGYALANPARLCWGLADAAEAAGVRIHEGSAATGLERVGAGVAVATPGGRVRARRCVLATAAFPPLLGAIRRLVVPVYDYVLVTEPLSPAQRDAIGWRRRQGLADSGNRFHYYRLTADDRILWGGYEAVYHYGNDMGPHRDQSERVHAVLADNFLATFPQLRGIRFSHRWGGAIDTCSRFCVTFGTAHGGAVAYAVGFTGLGVGASRFGARVALDLADGRDTELTRLELVRRRPLPFPPEPLRWLGITLTRRALAREDRTGRRGVWLRALDAAGMGFDS